MEKFFRDARASLIEDGTNDVLSLAGARQIIAKSAHGTNGTALHQHAVQ
jgi:alkylation response protein AidB-like acyl-CoA dehydrogenase